MLHGRRTSGYAKASPARRMPYKSRSKPGLILRGTPGFARASRPGQAVQEQIPAGLMLRGRRTSGFARASRPAHAVQKKIKAGPRAAQQTRTGICQGKPSPGAYRKSRSKPGLMLHGRRTSGFARASPARRMPCKDRLAARVPSMDTPRHFLYCIVFAVALQGILSGTPGKKATPNARDPARACAVAVIRRPQSLSGPLQGAAPTNRGSPRGPHTSCARRAPGPLATDAAAANTEILLVDKQTETSQQRCERFRPDVWPRLTGTGGRRP